MIIYKANGGARSIELSLLAVKVLVIIFLQPSEAFYAVHPSEVGEEDVIDLSEDVIPEPPNFRKTSRFHWSSAASPSPAPYSFVNSDEDVQSFVQDVLTSVAKKTSYASSHSGISGGIWDGGQQSTGHGVGPAKKRNPTNENHSGGCEASVTWIPLSAGHFPRYIKSYNCTSVSCDRNRGGCRPKFYAVKVLRMNTPENSSVADEDCDPNLPEKLRCDWKLVSVPVTTYCECLAVGAT